MSYPYIKPKIKTGKEKLKFKGKNLKFSMLDFWQWSASDILSNATRGIFAEFIVATAVGANLKEPREEWARYDVVSKDGIKIEVKTSAYLQRWHQDKLTDIRFSISPARFWDPYTNKVSSKRKRYADVYVFCLLACKDKSKVDPLNLEQWEFYVLSIDEVNGYKRSQSSITLKSLQRLAKSVSYSELYSAIKNKYKTKFKA